MHGKTKEMYWFSQSAKYFPKTEREQKPRDRSLSGKARVKARREARRD